MARLVQATESDIGGLMVSRLLPKREQRMVGPFIFFDTMGPAQFGLGEGIDVKPHPHIGLATITYLFHGSILHRDSLGSVQEIFPGDVNWMTAGEGIVHSERETLENRGGDHSLHGIQTWVALPQDQERIEPSFHHFKKNQLPHIMRDGVLMRLIAGSAYGRTSPVKTFSPMFYLDVIAAEDREIEHPAPGHQAAALVIEGSIEIAGESFSKNEFCILDDSDESITLRARSRIILLGGKAFETQPFINWNFVSFSKERIDDARRRWQAGEFPSVVGDNEEFVPLR